jgi:hypothetical protein
MHVPLSTAGYLWEFLDYWGYSPIFSGGYPGFLSVDGSAKFYLHIQLPEVPCGANILTLSKLAGLRQRRIK